MNDPSLQSATTKEHREEIRAGVISPPSFNLIHEPWLPITMRDGTTTDVGLAEFFALAHEAQGLNEPSPLTYTAVMRYLLAILHRATNGPQDPVDWASRWQKGRFDAEEVGSYLRRWEDRFDLFHPTKPFAQAGPEFIQKDPSPITRLFMERTSGNNPTLFDHAWDATPPGMSPAESARALLTAQGYAFAGSGGKFFNSTLIAGYSILFEGTNLFETLMLNLQEYSQDEPPGLQRHGDRDKPWWELESDPPIERGGNLPLGLTDLLTWRSRNIRLLPDPDGTVRHVYYEQRYQLRESGIRDPFKRYGQAASGPSKGQFFPKNFVAGRALWRDSFALIERQEEDDSKSIEDRPTPVIVAWLATAMNALKTLYGTPELVPTLIATGLVNNQAKIDLWRMDRLPLPVAVLTDSDRRLLVRDAVDKAKDVRDALYRAGSAFAAEALSLGERSPDPNDVARERASLKLDERYWSRLDVPFQQFMIGLADRSPTDDSTIQWKRGLRDIARAVFIEATNSAGLDSRWFRAQSYGARVLSAQLRKVLDEEIMDDRDPSAEEETA
ncbi:MAG: type I-E CRISPR-associated protein Cse1/CasA [Thermomicrobiales bacterium]